MVFGYGAEVRLRGGDHDAGDVEEDVEGFAGELLGEAGYGFGGADVEAWGWEVSE